MEKNTSNGIEWFIDDNGTLIINKTSDGDGKIILERETETARDYEIDNGEERLTERERIVANHAPWRSFWESITSLQIGEEITEISDNTFDNLQKITSVQLPSSLRKIGRKAFEGTPIEKIVIPEGVTDIENEAFCNCDKLREVVLPESLESLGCQAFQKCRSLEEIRIPSKITSIGQRTFDGCERLKTAILPDELGQIGKHAFLFCEGLTEIDLPEGLRWIDEGAFMACHNLKNISIPDSVEKIGKDAFNSCEVAIVPRHINNLDDIFGRDCRMRKSIKYRSVFSSLLRRKNK